MIIETLSTFPLMYESVMGSSMMKRARERGIIDFTAYDLRDWTHDRHRTTDDDPYGGGAGLVMRCEPIYEAVDALCGRPAPEGVVTGREQPLTGPAPQHPQGPAPTTVFLTPCGRRFDDALATELAGCERLLFVCGHYEGIDERAYDLADYQVSLGDYVLTSGELASMVVIDAVVRKLDGVLGAPDGATDESFVEGLLEAPQYTRPAVFRGREVPAVLLSGDHGAVARWRREQSLARTAALRPDLLCQAPLTPADRSFLDSCASSGADPAAHGIIFR
ncbi:tRNA (guanosine(37)-N1)-methyltransferase TrmD [Berryella wangjianweii]|uniref:tRNA (guanine-N(1)-)-methyltransferase n=1 Tax=Berryella wangjianweii TaxID=2734634 RepID=A0A6M8IZP4_9ACTN|nr:tRNA (guanosine(37)-N1)-methyltransferase TrmD [Berryella wangjianweii]QKF06804.1 tRNA (guanosine(37)-N1)-methyltransferase TrmD [Berryella wangjianweii]